MSNDYFTRLDDDTNSQLTGDPEALAFGSEENEENKEE